MVRSIKVFSVNEMIFGKPRGNLRMRPVAMGPNFRELKFSVPNPQLDGVEGEERGWRLNK